MDSGSAPIVFVYGTLKRGYRLHQYMEGARFLGEARLNGYRMHRVSWYPAIRPDADYSVYGELFEINEDILAILDEVEDRGTEYERELCLVQPLFPSETDSIQALVYVYLHQLDDDIIENGVF
tara:strand:- start:14928 stop:15296 length:369 start_codon:yes stop_codon:yes gene_type:complete